MTDTSTYIVPKLSEGEAHQASAFRLDSYIMHIQHTSCTCCKNVFVSSNFFEVWIMPKRGNGAESRRLKPCDALPLPTLPVGKSRLQNKTVPLCWRCVDGVPQPYTEYDTEAAWRDTLSRKANESEEPKIEPQKKKESTSVVRLDQL